MSFWLLATGKTNFFTFSLLFPWTLLWSDSNWQCNNLSLMRFGYSTCGHLLCQPCKGPFFSKTAHLNFILIVLSACVQYYPDKHYTSQSQSATKLKHWIQNRNRYDKGLMTFWFLLLVLVLILFYFIFFICLKWVNA